MKQEVISRHLRRVRKRDIRAEKRRRRRIRRRMAIGHGIIFLTGLLVGVAIMGSLGAI